MGIDNAAMSSTVEMPSDRSMDSTLTEKLLGGGRKIWATRRRKIFIALGVVATLVVIALAVGLGVGLTQDNGGDDDSDSSSDNSSNSSGDVNSDNGLAANGTIVEDPTFDNATMWQPAVGTSWQLVLAKPLNSTLPNGTAVWDIDLYDNNKTTITGLQSHGAKVICYFSAGSYEDWRVDASKFHADDLGHNLDGWPGERWLNVSSPNVRTIMLARLDLAKAKGCNGVDPDNVDGYDNDNGLNLTQAQAVDYVRWLSSAAHIRGMSVGLKNAGAIIPDVLNYVQWSVNEQCVQFGECDTYAAFVKAGKPVFHVEYPKGDKTNNNVNISSTKKTQICSNTDAKNFSTIIKNMNLDLWEQTC